MKLYDLIHDLEIYLMRLGYNTKSTVIICNLSRAFIQRMKSEQIEKVKDITSSDLIDYYQYLNRRPNKRYAGGLSEVYIDQHIYALKLFFEWQMTIGAISENPMSTLRFPRGTSDQREILTQSEIHQLYELSETWLEKTMLSLYYGCGLRRTEGVNLDLTDVHFRSKMLYVRHGKGNRRRVVPMSDKVKESIYRYVYEERWNPKKLTALVINSKGGRMRDQSYDRLLRKLMARSGIEKKISLHSLRHSIGTHLLESGMKIEQVQEFLGHKHIGSTMRYTRVSKTMMYGID